MLVIALMKKEPQRAIQYLEAVLRPIPQADRSGRVRAVIDDPQLRHTGQVQKLLGRAYQMVGDLPAARRHLDLSHQIDPTDLDVVLLLAWVAEGQRDGEARAAYLRRFLERAPPHDRRRDTAARKLREGMPAAP